MHRQMMLTRKCPPSHATLSCQFCAADTTIHHVVSEGALRRCTQCGFIFFHSNETAYDPLRTFARAYAGDEQTAGMGDFSLRMTLRVDADAAGIEPTRLMSSAQHAARDIIRRRLPKGATVLVIGCGTGHLIGAIKADGYKPFGLDVAEPVVQLLRREGFPVWHGTIDSVPDGWVDPDVCTALFVLHHTLDAAEFLKTIRTKYPRALVILAVYNDLDSGVPPATARSLPPRTYSWWGTPHLRLALEVAGYQAHIQRVRRRATDGGLPVSMGLYTWLRRRAPTAAGRFLRYYYATLPVWGWAPVLWDSRIRRFSDPLLGIGVPRQ